MHQHVDRFLVLLAVLGAGLTAPARGQAALPNDFSDQTLVTGLSQPAGLAFLPDGRILVTEQKTGNLRLIAQGALVAGAAYTQTQLQTSNGEQGLLGLAVDPRWPEFPYVYILFNRTPGNVMYLSRLTASGSLSDSTATNLSFASRYDLLTDIPDNAGNHNGGTLRFGPDDMLYASLGDDASACTAQDSTDLRGCILRLQVDALPAGSGGPPNKALLTPPDNPYPPGGTPNLGLIYAFGLRNPFRFTVDPITGELNIGDVGSNSYEELDRSTGGENFGWPFREGPQVRLQGGCTEPGGSGSQSYTGPIASYSHSGQGPLSIIAGPAYRPVGGGVHSFPVAYDEVAFYLEYYVGFIRALKRVGGAWQPFTAPGQPDAENWGTDFDFCGDMIRGPDGAMYWVKQFPGELHRIVYTGEQVGLGDPHPIPPPRLWAAPNPFRAGDPLRLGLASGGTPNGPVAVYTATGRHCRTLAPVSLGEGGAEAWWDGKDERGIPVPAGLYLVRWQTSAGPAAARVVRLP